MIPSKKYVLGHCVRLVNKLFITLLRGIVGVNAKQVAAKQHHYTANDHYRVDVRSRVSNQPEKIALCKTLNRVQNGLKWSEKMEWN